MHLHSASTVLVCARWVYPLPIVFEVHKQVLYTCYLVVGGTEHALRYSEDGLGFDNG